MDVLNTKALDALAAALKSLLPPVADPTLAPELNVIPVRITPAGLGSLIGLQDDPQGALRGRRVQARVLVTVKGATSDVLNKAVAATSQAFMAADRVALRQLGILDLKLDDLGLASIRVGDGAAIAQRDLTMTVLFEFVSLPAQGEDTIREIPLNLKISS